MTEIRIPANISPLNETLRLKKLKYYEILDTPAENSFDTIALLAAEIFDVPNAAITFVDDDRIFFKSGIGSIPLNDQKQKNFCTLAILSQDITLIENKLLTDNRLVQDIETDVIFYAASPLLTNDGYAIGTIQVSDFLPRYPSHQQLDMLKKLSEMIMDKLESRIFIRKTLKAHDDRLNMLVHDLKNPMTTISLQTELIGRLPGIDEKTAAIAGKINLQSKSIVNKLNHMLSSAKRVNGSFKPQKERINLSEVFSEIKNTLNFYINKKRQVISINFSDTIEIYADREKIIEIFKQLISNAVKFSGDGNEIKISVLTAADVITITVKDDGSGLHADELEHVFTKFAILSSKPMHGEDSNGLGLSLVKILVDLHQGRIWVESNGKNQGTAFTVELPLK